MTADWRRLVAEYDAGKPLESFTAPERTELRRLIVQAPGYLDPKHEHHSTLIDDAKRLYAMDTPEQAE